MPKNQILIINGPNLNLLGSRDQENYGSFTLDELREYIEKKDAKKNKLYWYQSNIEGEIVEKIQWAIGKKISNIIINPAGYTHTSVAIKDALEIFQGAIVEVHISNIFKREPFRQTLLTASEASLIISGAGIESYNLAINYINSLGE